MKKVTLRSLLTAVLLLAASLRSFGLDVQVVGKLEGGAGSLHGSDWRRFLRARGAVNRAQLALSVGAFLDLALLPNVALQSGIALARTGGAYAYNLGPSFYQGQATATLIEVPVLIRPSFEAGTGKVHAFLGPSLYLLLGDFVRTVEGGGKTTTDNLPPARSAQWGAAGGMGYSFPFGRGTAVAELKYSRSLTALFDNQDTSLTRVSAQIGYALPLARRAERD
jgi:hypothetical protein